jgi:hypothetical protein
MVWRRSPHLAIRIVKALHLKLQPERVRRKFMSDVQKLEMTTLSSRTLLGERSRTGTSFGPAPDWLN